MDNFFGLFSIDWSFIETIGDNPFAAMWFLFTHGGWIAFVYFFGWASVKSFQSWRQNLFNAKKQFIILSISVPRAHEQTPRAVDNMFAFLAGAHSSNSWTEDWIVGRTQDTISCEIVSIEGSVQFIVRTTRGLRDLVEAAIYSQYQDADIVEVQDYTDNVPHKYPDEEWDMWGTQFIQASKNDMYIFKTYPTFEDKVSGEFKDPLAGMLESLARMRKDEQAWFQIVLTPIDQKAYGAKGQALIKKLKGEKEVHKKSMLDGIVDFPITLLNWFGEGIGLIKPPEHKKEDKSPFNTKMFNLTETEREILKGVETKTSKIGYLAKMRFIYVAKKNVFSKSHIAQGFVGSIKQFNTNNMGALKPDFKKVGMTNAMWWFKDRRNAQRKRHLMSAFRKRSNWVGFPNMFICTEELATLWHFPITFKAPPPQLKKTESKKNEPPINIPFG